MQSPAGPLIRSLQPRDPAEQNRVATPLELLTDLCFVVAVSQAAAQLHHFVAEGQVAHGVVGFAMAFFAVWWTWLNFTWFASAYDNDDIAYRLLTVLQIIGSLVIAAGIPALFEGNLVWTVLGYLIMRVALVLQWLRAARSDPPHAITCRRYAVGIVVVQLLWVSILFLPRSWLIPAFVIFALLEFAVPVFAERAGMTTWHPHHVAERYGLFYIIVLGEVVLSVLTSIQQALADLSPGTGEGASEASLSHIVMVAAAGVGIVFSVWWIYFSRSAAPALYRHQQTASGQSYLWGYGHYLIFGSAAAIGAALQVRIDFWEGHADVHEITSSALITVPVAVLLGMIWVLHLRFHDTSWRTVAPFGTAVAAVLASTFAPYTEVITAAVCVLLVIVEVRVASLVGSPD
jgi:low temperature requirement protein LtrA